MARYESDLIGKFEKMNNRVKWIIIILAVLIAFFILIKGVSNNNNNRAGQDSLQTISVEDIDSTAIAIPQTENLQANKVVKNLEKKEKEKPKVQKPIPKRKKKRQKKKPQQLNNNFASSFSGYRISGVAISHNSVPIVYLKKEDKTETYSIGDKISDYTISEIHRTYILLKKGTKIIHLNYIH